ncbi:MAG: hypothetical protein MPJ22_00030 [Pirellulales bacterium]|nr:hypothetical protein [Pirellulales bacterium]MDA8040795.1 hypothetical protein [Pirellulales bacterium]
MAGPGELDTTAAAVLGGRQDHRPHRRAGNIDQRPAVQTELAIGPPLELDVTVQAGYRPVPWIPHKIRQPFDDGAARPAELGVRRPG